MSFEQTYKKFSILFYLVLNERKLIRKKLSENIKQIRGNPDPICAKRFKFFIQSHYSILWGTEKN